MSKLCLKLIKESQLITLVGNLFIYLKLYSADKLCNLFHLGIVLGINEYLNRFFLQDNCIRYNYADFLVMLL